MDHFLFTVLYSLGHRSPLADGLIVFFAEYFPYVVLLAALCFLFRISPWKKRVHVFLFLALGVTIARGVFVETIRFLFPLPRPFTALPLQPLLQSDSPGFPSGHASLFFALAFAALFFNRAWGFVFLGAALVNGVARVAAGLHFPGDIVGGAAVGAASFGIAYLLLGAQSHVFSSSGQSSP